MIEIGRRDALRVGGLGLSALWLNACGDTGLARFPHGVASADPTPSGITLWTRVAEIEGDTTLEVIVARDELLADVVVSQTIEALADDDHCVSVHIDGLDADRTFFYGFVHQEIASPIGRTRTAPTGDPDAVRIAFTCCASYAHGYFHTYARIAERDDLAAVVHLGDYMYEYPDGGYGDLRRYDPPHLVVSLSDYRRRYAHYRLDPDLAFLHASHPLIVTWDDHEFTNNSWFGAGRDHDPAVLGPWEDRRVSATKAHREWLPRREQRPGSLYRQLPLSNLVDLFVLDTRMEGRDAPPADFAASIAPGRTILGLEQRAALFEGLRTSTARWKVIAHSVQLSPHLASFWNFDAWDGYADERRIVLEMIRDEGIEGVLFVCGDGHKTFADDLPLAPRDPASYDPTTGEGSIAIELMTPAASSPNLVGAAARALEEMVLTRDPQTRFVETESRGYWVLELTEERALASLYFVSGIEDPDGGEQHLAHEVEVRAGERHLARSES